MYNSRVIVCRGKVNQIIHTRVVVWGVFWFFYLFKVFIGNRNMHCSYPKSNSIKWRKLKIHHKQHEIRLVLFFYLGFTKENQASNTFPNVYKKDMICREITKKQFVYIGTFHYTTFQAYLRIIKNSQTTAMYSTMEDRKKFRKRFPAKDVDVKVSPK